MKRPGQLKSRSAPLRSREPARGGYIQRKTRIKPRNAKRRKSEFERCYHSEERVLFVKSLPCENCLSDDGQWDGREYRRIANAHIRNDGAGIKGPYTAIVPLCETLGGAGCHDLQHDHGWSELPGLDTPEKREAAAARTEAAWQLHLRQTGRARQDTDNG